MDETEPRWKAQLDGWVADRQLGKVLAMLPTVAAGSNPAHWGELSEVYRDAIGVVSMALKTDSKVMRT